MNFLKSLGLGLVIVILSPILLLGISLLGIIMLIEWVVMFVKGVVRFFKGDSFFKPLPEDLIVQEIKVNEMRNKTNPQPEVQPAPQPAPQNIYVTNYYQYPGQNNAQQPMPQGNPYLNQQPINQIEERNDFVDGNAQEAKQQEDLSTNAIEMKIVDEEGGIE